MSQQNPVAVSALNQRVWFVEGGVHPLHQPVYLALGKISTDPSQKMGESKRITAPDPNHYNRDIQVGTVEGETQRASFAVQTRYTQQKSVVLEWVRKGCRVDVFVLTGKCGNPQDFSEGGEKWTYFPDGRLSQHNFNNYSAFGRDENKETSDTVDMTAEEYYEFLYMRQDQIGSAVTSREIMTVDTYAGDNCADCPTPCAQVLMTMKGTAATPGTIPALLYSGDTGVTFSQQSISTMFSNEEAVDSAVIGGDLVLIGNTSNSIHYTNIELLFDGTNVWMENIVGFVGGKAPRAIWSADVRHTWICGDGGYIYFVQNHKTAVVVQDPGIATTQVLLDIHAYDTKNVLAVGNSNAVVYTQNGGQSWESVVGPATGINLSSCWMWSSDTWFVGEGAGGQGRLWLTTNSGKSWVQMQLPGTYSRIYKIEFVSEAEGYIAATTGSTGVVLRTKSAGSEWVTLPEGKRATAAANAYLSDLAVCSKYANTVFATGLATGGATGIAFKFGGSYQTN